MILKEGSRPASEKAVTKIFYVLLILHLIPLFFGKYFLTQDGPSHLYNAFVFKDLVLNHHSFYAQYFDINKVPNPNWLVTVFYALVMMILPAFMAEKLFLVCYVLLLPFSFRFLIRQINPQSGFVTLLIFPLVYNITLFLGFFNFCFSIILYFYTVGYWLKHQGVFSFRKQFVFLMLVTLTYFSHPVSFVVLCLTIGTLMLSALYQDTKNEDKPIVFFFKRLAGLIIGLLPSTFFFLLFFRGSGSEISFTQRYLKGYIIDQLQNYGLNYFGKIDLVLCTAFIAILALFFIYNLFARIRYKRLYRLDVLYLFFALFSIMTFFSPEEIAGGSVILIRLILYSNIIAILCISVYSYSEKLKWVSAYFFFGFAVFWLGFKAWHFEKIHEQLTDLMGIEDHISEGKTLLPFVVQKSNADGSPLDTTRDIDINVFLHASMYICLEKRLVCLSDYEASQSYFPLKWKPGKDPSMFFPESGEILTDSSLQAYFSKTGTLPDYILVWDETGWLGEGEGLMEELEKHYVLDSKASEFTWLYMRIAKI